MADVTGRIGDNEVELNNAATEATLKALLLASAGSVKEMKKLAKLAEKAGMDARAIQDAEAAVRALGDNTSAASSLLGKLNPLLGGLGKTASIAGSVLGDVAASAFKTVGNLTDLAGAMMDGQGTVSGLMAAFKDLPFGLGLVAGLFEKIAKIQEENLVAYQQLSKSGINFAGQLLEMKQAGLELGLTLEQFGTVLAANSQSLAMMGANAEDGSKNFVRLAKDLRNSQIGEQLRALGFTAEDTANGLANYIKMTGGRTAEEMRNTKGLAESAGAYMKQLDMLATLTGKSREEQENALKEAQQNAAFEAYLQTLDEDGRKKAMAGLAHAMFVGGKDAVQLLQSRLMGIPPVAEGAQMLAAALPNAANGIYGIADAVKDSSKTMVDVNRASSQAMAGTQTDMKKYSKEMLASMSMVGGPGSQTLLTAQANLNRAYKQGLVTQQDFEKAMGNITEAQNRAGSQADAAAKSQKALQDAGANIFAALAPVIEELTKQLNGLAIWFTGFLNENKGAMAEFGKTLTGILEWVRKTLTDLFSPGGMDRQIDKLGKFLGEIMQKAWDNFKIFGGGEVEAPSGGGMDLDRTPPAAANGAVLSGPRSGFEAVLHGTEAVVPLPDGRNIPVSLDLNMPKALNFQQPDTASLVAEMQKMQTKNQNPFGNLEETFANFFGNKPETADADVTGKILITELQTLNKQTAEMLAHVRDTADTGRRSIDALRGLSGNLYPV